MKDWQSPDTQMPEAHPEMLALSDQVANTKLDANQRLSAATHLANTKAGKLYLVSLAAKQLLPDAIRNQIRDKMLDLDDRYLKPPIANYFELSDSSSYNIEAIADLPADVDKGKALMYGNCLVCHKMGRSRW